MCVLEPVGFALAEGEQEASGQLTASVMMHLHAWRPCQLQYVADAFSTQFETAVTPQELAAEDLACMLNETASSTVSGPLPDADAQLRACFVSYGPAQVTPYRDGASEKEKAAAAAYLHLTGVKPTVKELAAIRTDDVRIALLRAALGSVADRAIIPMYDWLGLGAEAHLNTPGKLGGNWAWRASDGFAAKALAKTIHDECSVYCRV